jgi:signal transduction histidine kinase
MAWTRRLGQPLLLGLGFAILVAISVMSLGLVSRLQADTAQVTESLRVESRLRQVLLMVRRAESAQRGFLLTNDPSYLDPYNDSIDQVMPALDELAASLAEAPSQQEALARVEPLMRQKVDELRETVRLHKSGESERALALVKSNEGLHLMENAAAISQQIITEQRRLVQEHIARSNRTDNGLLYATGLGSLLVVILAGLSVVGLRASNRERDAAQRALVEANAGLEDAVAERTGALQDANEEIQRFAYIVSHDLRSPLVNIMGFTSELEALRKDIFAELAAVPERDEAALARETQLGQDFDEAVHFIKTAIAKMDRLIDAVLRLSREGRREFRPEALDMTELVRNLAGTVAHQTTELGATLTVEPLPGVTSDRLALEQIFSNLIDNALKYLRAEEPGRIEIRGRAGPTSVTYEVRDNGRGIDPRDHERVFELFRRSGPQDRPGEGIGLAHVRALVRRLGGTLTLQSMLGQGSTFIVTLPRFWTRERGGKAA